MSLRKDHKRKVTPAADEAGVTLIEMLVVLAILLLAVMLAVPLVKGPSPERILETASVDIARRVRAVRTAAITSNGEARILIDVDARTIGSEIDDATTPLLDGRPYTLQGGITLTVTAAAADVQPGRIAAIRFFPDGSSTGGRIELRLGERRRVVAVDWLSGRATRLGQEPRGAAP